MPRNIDPAIVTALDNYETLTVAFLVLVEFPAPNRLAFTTLLDNYDYEGDTFFGLGSIGQVSMPQGDGELSPKQYSVSLNGISDDILTAATQLNYLNHKVTCWQMWFDEDSNQVGTPMVAWRGLTDSISVNFGSTSRVVINVTDRLVDWERPKIERYTNGDQQSKYPNDRGLEFVSQIATKEANWPDAAWFTANTE